MREAAPALENGEPIENASLARAEQVVAPGDGGIHRALALGKVAVSVRENSEPVVESRQERLRRKDSHTRRGELDREREPVEPATDVRDGARVALGEREAALGLARPLGEERDRRVSQQRVDVSRPACGRKLERRDGHHALGRHAERRAARDERSERRGIVEQSRDERRRVDDLLEVVEDEQQPPRDEVPGKRVDGGRAAGLLEPERPGDRRGDEERVADRRQVDEEDTVREVRNEIARDSSRESGLPVPPGPVSVTRRAPSRRRLATARTSSARPRMRSV